MISETESPDKVEKGKAEKAAQNWFCSLIAIGFLLPFATFAAYVNVFQFIEGWEPIGGKPTDASTLEAMGASGDLLLTHWLLYLIFGMVAYRYIVSKPDQLRQRKWIVTGGVLGLVVASAFFALTAAAYQLGNEYDLFITILIMGNGIFGLLPGGISVLLGALLGYLAFKLVRQFEANP